jgi:hypothetical protein
MTDDLERSFAQLAVEHWRLIRTLTRLVERAPLETQARLAAQCRFAAARLAGLAQEREFRLEMFDGRLFEPGLPVSAINAEEFPPGSELRIVETLEPTVLRDGRVVQVGKVALDMEPVSASRN